MGISKNVSLRMTEDTHKRLKIYAAVHGSPLYKIVSQAIDDFLACQNSDSEYDEMEPQEVVDLSYD